MDRGSRWFLMQSSSLTQKSRNRRSRRPWSARRPLKQIPKDTRSRGAHMTRKAKSTDALHYVHEKYVGNSPERRRKLEEAVFFAVLAQQIYALRTAAGLSQKQLAERVDTTASVIS